MSKWNEALTETEKLVLDAMDQLEEEERPIGIDILMKATSLSYPVIKQALLSLAAFPGVPETLQ